MSSWAPPDADVTRLVLVRHGSTVHSLARRFSGRNELPLDDAGQAQAAALSARPFGDVAAVVSSPLRRTTQTATAIAVPLGLPVTTVDDLVETDFGRWEGLSAGEVRDGWGEEFAAWVGDADLAPPGGESFTAVAARVERARDELLREHAGSTVIVVSHVTPIKTLLRLAIGAPPIAMYRIHLDTASVSLVDYRPDGTPSVRLVNDTGHLRDG